MRTMKSSMRLYALLCAALLPVMMCLSCNKLITDLIPPDEQKLISLDLRMLSGTCAVRISLFVII